MNMRKIIAVLAAVLMLCAIIPMSVFAAPGDVVVNKNFDDGSVFSNARAENGYMVFDATTANWANVYLYANSIKNATKYEITFDCKANKATNINVKINNNWAGDTFAWTTNVTTEWKTYSCVITTNELKELTSTALLMFTSNTKAADGAVYHIDNVKVVEYTDPDTVGKIVNGSFEDGTASWTCDSSASLYTADAYEGSNSLKLANTGYYASAATQIVSVKANTNYELVWYSKRLSGTGAFNIILCQPTSPWTNYSKVSGQNWMNETSGNWVKNSYTINTGDNTSMLIKWTSERSGDAGEILLDAIQLVELKNPSDDGFIKNGDFETGKATPWTLYSTTVDADAAKSGDYGLHIKYASGGWGGTAYQDFTVEVGKTYVVMLDAKAITKGQNIQVQNPIGTNVKSNWYTNTSWTTLSFEFTATTTDARINICGGGTGVSEEIYVDNVFVFEKKAASNDGYIVNGDFETGTMDGLSPSQQTCVSRDAAKDGNFGLKMLGNGGWGGVGKWTINTLEPGATYKFEMDMNAIEQGFNWTLWQDVVDSGTKYASGYFSTKAWTHIEKEFVANSSVAVLNINGGGNGNAETVYLDNLKITLVKPAHTCEFVGVETKAPTCTEPGVMTYSCTCGEGTYTVAIPANNHSYDGEYDVDCNACGEIRVTDTDVVTSFGGNSISEDVNGLAFKFDIQASISIAFERISEIDYANSYIGGFKLVGMGAVASNNGSDTVLDNLGDQVIDIPARWLCNLVEGSASFAVRIIEIPEANYNTVITARPYYIFEDAEGAEITIYGEEQAASFNSALG